MKCPLSLDLPLPNSHVAAWTVLDPPLQAAARRPMGRGSGDQWSGGRGVTASLYYHFGLMHE